MNTEDADAPRGQTSRRRVVAATAWSVPVIITSVASPAAAASQREKQVLVAPDEIFVGDDLSSTVFVTMSGDDGPRPAEHVTLTVSDPSIAAFAGSPELRATTDGSGIAFALGLVALSPGPLTITATSRLAIHSETRTVLLGQGTLAFAQPSYEVARGASGTYAGTVTATRGPRPTSLSIAYAPGVTSPAEVDVLDDGTFRIAGVKSTSEGVIPQAITVSAVGFGDATTELVTVAGYVALDQQVYHTYLDVGRANISGVVRTFDGAALPSTLSITYPGKTTNTVASVAVGADGRFSLPPVGTTDNGTSSNVGTNLGTLTVSAPGFVPSSARIQALYLAQYQLYALDIQKWDPSIGVIPQGATITLRGINPPSNRTLPGRNPFQPGEVATLRYTGDFSGPDTVRCDSNWQWTVDVSNNGTIGSGSVTIISPANPSVYVYPVSLVTYE